MYKHAKHIVLITLAVTSFAAAVYLRGDLGLLLILVGSTCSVAGFFISVYDVRHGKEHAL